MSVTFRVELATSKGFVLVERNHNNARACDLMNRAGVKIGEDLCGKIEHKDLLPAIKKLLDLHQEAKLALHAYENHESNPTNIPFDQMEYYEYGSQGLLGIFSLAYTFGKNVYYS